MTRMDGFFRLRLNDGVSLALLWNLRGTCSLASAAKISAFGLRTMVNEWSRCAAAEHGHRIEVARGYLRR